MYVAISISLSVLESSLLSLPTPSLGSRLKLFIVAKTENKMSVSLMSNKTVRAKRRVRAKQSVICLQLSRHDLRRDLLLDLGCGGGWLTEYYLNLGIEAIGLDIHKRMSILKKRLPTSEFVRADGRRIPFRDKVFQTVILNDVLEHIPYSSADKLMTEIKRILNPTSRLYISVANRYNLIEPHTGIWFLTWFPRSCWDAIYRLTTKRQTFNYYPYTVKELIELCEKHKFLCENFTWVFASEKVRHPECIINIIAKVLRRLKLLRATLAIAEKVSVILFVCRKLKC